MRRLLKTLFVLLITLGGVCACAQVEAHTEEVPPTLTASAAALPTKTLEPSAVVADAISTATPEATLAPSATPTVVNTIPLPETVSGVVQNAEGVLAGAIVQLKGTPIQAVTNAHGRFTIQGLSGTTPAILTAWSEGYYVGWTSVNPSAPDYPGSDGLKITLKPLDEKDHSEYTWFKWAGVSGSDSCGLCHREYAEYKRDAHSQSAQNPRFLSMYLGTDLAGNVGQATKYGDQGAALPPDPNLPYYGPGFKLDTPNRAGNCATCHTPVASTVPNQRNCGWSGCHTDLTIERSNGVIEPATLPIGTHGDGAEGVTCDFCHKIGDVTLDEASGLPKPDMPGILSYRLYRPAEGQQVFFGTLVDVNRRVSYLPLESRSEFCAPCHYGVFGGVVGVGSVSGGTTIYNSYGEWLDSPYSDPQTGKTCQNCHMPVLDVNYFVFPDQGGITRDYAEFHDHYMPGAADEALLQNTVTLAADAIKKDGQLKVQVELTNHNAGHHVPTDAPTRQMILVVEATDSAGNLLELSEGAVNPEWAGNYAGVPGKTYMKVLRDEWTGETPSGAYWRPVKIVEDTRLAALATDTQQFTFALPSGAAATVHVRVIFRRTFQTLAEQKGWTDPDILMEETRITVE